MVYNIIFILVVSSGKEVEMSSNKNTSLEIKQEQQKYNKDPVSQCWINCRAEHQTMLS